MKQRFIFDATMHVSPDLPPPPTPAPRRVALLGECMLELQGQAFGALQMGYGGDTFNTAVYLARCSRGAGISVRYATALGDDALSDGLLQRWAAEGLDLGLVRRLPGRMPGLYLIDTDAQGERHFSYWRESAAARSYFEAGCEQAPTPLEAQAATLDLLYCSGITLAILPPAGRERLFALMQALRGRGAQVVFDNNFRPRLWPDPAVARQAYARAYALASTALLTLDDEQALWGEPDAALQLQRCLELPPDELVVKRGAAPALVRLQGEPAQQVPAEAVARVVDTTAAGDSFGAGYLAARLRGAAPTDAARAGHRLAARVVQHRGAVIDIALMADLLPA
jgi:2-dehydro-3-deoxygluconokinase